MHPITFGPSANRKTIRGSQRSNTKWIFIDVEMKIRRKNFHLNEYYAPCRPFCQCSFERNWVKWMQSNDIFWHAMRRWLWISCAMESTRNDIRLFRHFTNFILSTLVLIDTECHLERNCLDWSPLALWFWFSTAWMKSKSYNQFYLMESCFGFVLVFVCCATAEAWVIYNTYDINLDTNELTQPQCPTAATTQVYSINLLLFMLLHYCVDATLLWPISIRGHCAPQKLMSYIYDVLWWQFIYACRIWVRNVAPELHKENIYFYILCAKMRRLSCTLRTKPYRIGKNNGREKKKIIGTQAARVRNHFLEFEWCIEGATL